MYIESRKSNNVAHTSVINLKAGLQNLKLPKNHQNYARFVNKSQMSVKITRSEARLI